MVAPSRWLLERARESILAPAIADSFVIPNAVNLKVFVPGDRAEARRQLGWPHDARILLFAASGGAGNRFKDPATVRRAVARFAQQCPSSRETIFVFLGGTDPPTKADGYRELSVRILDDPSRVAVIYRAADAYVHAAHSDNFPTSVLEAMASGCPVIATAVGGIPEQFNSLDLPMGCASRADAALPAAGVLTPPGDHEAMAQALAAVLGNSDVAERLANGARTTAERLYGLETQVRRYSDLYLNLTRRGAKSVSADVANVCSEAR